MRHLPDVQAVQHQHQLSIRNLEQQMAAGAAQVKKVKHMDFLKNWNISPLELRNS